MQTLQGGGPIMTGMSGCGLGLAVLMGSNHADSLFIPAKRARGTSAALGGPAPWAAVLSASLNPFDALRAFFLGLRFTCLDLASIPFSSVLLVLASAGSPRDDGFPPGNGSASG